MRIGRGLLAALFFCGIAGARSQDAAPPKKFDHWAGLQVNELVRQLVNLNADDDLVDNPYLVKYAVFADRCRWGLQAGFGFRYDNFEDKLSPTGQASRIYDVFYRAGVAHRFSIGKRWEVVAGLDFAGSRQSDKTHTLQVLDQGARIDTTVTYSNSVVKGRGGGLQLGLQFQVSGRIWLGTEATFYFMEFSDKQSVVLTEIETWPDFPENNSYSVSSSNSDIDHTAFEITVPAVLFLLIRF
jgi:hypothetical protein